MSAPRFDRLRELFAAALPLGDADRAAYLDRECEGDAALREGVESLLEIDAATPDEHHAASLDGVSAAEWLAADLADDADATEPLPARIGRFEIIREIGRGGMGVVYEAQQDDPARRVALKVIHPGMISRGLLRRFRQETRAMGQLLHPGIAQIYEAGTSADGGAVRPYFAMELVEGPTLVQFASAGRLDARARLELVARVCDALQHAHQKGVIHRDLKPENILVQNAGPDAAAGTHAGLLPPAVQPKILDFGVSRLAEESDAVSLRTQSGQIVGTIPYLSPEQAAGDSAVADIRSDVYSMGVVAYELLSGMLPFDTAGRTVRAATRIVLEQPARRLGATDRRLRGDIETIVHKAMARDPERRYQSAADLAADIRRSLAREPIAARTPSAAYSVRKFAERNRALAFVGTGSLVFMLGALVVVSMLWADARRAEELAAWQRYRSAMSAASFALSNGEIGIARRHLDSAGPRFRGWEYRHFLSRLDESTSVSRPGLGGPFMIVPPTDGGAPGLVLLETEESGTLARVEHESGPLVPLDPNLRLWYSARGSRATDALKVSGPVLYAADPATGQAVPHRIADWPFGPGQVFDDPRLSDDGHVMVMLDRTRAAASLVVVDLEADRVLRIDLGADSVPIRAAVSADGTRAAVSTGFNQPRAPFARVFDTRTGQTICTVDDLNSEPRSLLLSADGSRLTAAFHGGRLGSWDVTVHPARSLVQRPYTFDSIENLNFNRDQTLLVAGNVDGIVRVFDAGTLENTLALIGHESEIHDVRFLPSPSAGGEGLISAGRDGTVRRWSLGPSARPPIVLHAHSHLVHALAIGNAGRFVATGSWDATVGLFSLDDGRELGRMRTGTFVQAMALSPDERTIVTREFGGDVRLFDVAARSQIALLDRRSSTLDLPLFDAASQRVLVDFDPAACTALFYDIPSRGWVSEPGEQIAAVRGATVSTSTNIIARTETRDRWFGAVLYDYRTGKEVLALPTRRPANESLAFSPDGRTVVTPDQDHRLQAYELPTGRHLGTYSGHAREVLALVFSPDGSRLFSADYTGTIWVWDTRTREELTQLRGHQEHVRRLVISADGTTLLSGSRDGTARVWTAPTTEGPGPRR